MLLLLCFSHSHSDWCPSFCLRIQLFYFFPAFDSRPHLLRIRNLQPEKERQRLQQSTVGNKLILDSRLITRKPPSVFSIHLLF